MVQPRPNLFASRSDAHVPREVGFHELARLVCQSRCMESCSVADLIVGTTIHHEAVAQIYFTPLSVIDRGDEEYGRIRTELS